MKKIILGVGMFIGLVHLNQAKSQTPAITIEDNSPETYYYVYSFEGAVSEESVMKTKETISGLLHVTEVKVNFKSDSGKGEFKITVVEKSRTKESEEMFSPKMVKEAILANGIQPIDFTFSQEINH